MKHFFFCNISVSKAMKCLFRRAPAAVRTMAANFQPAHNYLKFAVTLDLPFEAVEQLAFQFDDLSAAQAGHVYVIALRTPLVIMFLALHVHHIEFVY